MADRAGKHKPILAALILISACSPSLAPEDRELARRIDFDPGVVATVKGIGGELGQLVREEDFNPSPVRTGLSLAVDANDAYDIVRRLQSKLAKRGYQVFRSRMNFGSEPDQAGVIRSSDTLDVLRFCGTNGINYDLENSDVITKFKEWNERLGLRLVGAGFDWLEADMERVPADMLLLAKEIHAFCPDVVDQGTGSVEELARVMKETGTLYLWWD